MDQFDRTRKFRPWLFTIASNKARDYLRAQARQHTVSQSALGPPKNSGRDDAASVLDLLMCPLPGPGDQAESSETSAMVRQVVQAMPEHLRTPLLLAYFHQHPYKQIAEILDVPLGTVKSRVHAAVAFFAASWKKAGNGPNRGV
jgi:RNA polymerase sigma-70 factor (ECF subfamily)